MQTLDTYSFKGKRTLVRVDFNVPFDKSGNVITDDSRIRKSIPTIRRICEKGGRVILLSHMGRPKGKHVESLSLEKIAQAVSVLIGKNVAFCDECIGERAEQATRSLQDGDILLLENVRFHPEEEGKVAKIEGETPEQLAQRKQAMLEAQIAFSARLARCGDCFVNDAFSAAHRAHASTTYIANHFPNDRMFGLLMEQELQAMNHVMHNPQRPLVAIMGGAKVSDKLILIENLLPKVDKLIIGGGMSYTFIRAQGGQTGLSLCEENLIKTAADLLQKAQQLGVELILPTDAVNAPRLEAGAPTTITPIDQTPADQMGLDIGPASIKHFADVIAQAGTVLWNGPMGVFEIPDFQAGTFAIAKALAQATANGAFTLVGGGDSVAALKASGNEAQVSYVSTGGGAMLEYLEGKTLPGIAAIQAQ